MHRTDELGDGGSNISNGARRLIKLNLFVDLHLHLLSFDPGGEKGLRKSLGVDILEGGISSFPFGGEAVIELEGGGLAGRHRVGEETLEESFCAGDDLLEVDVLEDRGHVVEIIARVILSEIKEAAKLLVLIALVLVTGDDTVLDVGVSLQTLSHIP